VIGRLRQRLEALVDLDRQRIAAIEPVADDVAWFEGRRELLNAMRTLLEELERDELAAAASRVARAVKLATTYDSAIEIDTYHCEVRVDAPPGEGRQWFVPGRSATSAAAGAVFVLRELGLFPVTSSAPCAVRLNNITSDLPSVSIDAPEEPEIPAARPTPWGQIPPAQREQAMQRDKQEAAYLAAVRNFAAEWAALVEQGGRDAGEEHFAQAAEELARRAGDDEVTLLMGRAAIAGVAASLKRMAPAEELAAAGWPSWLPRAEAWIDELEATRLTIGDGSAAITLTAAIKFWRARSV